MIATEGAIRACDQRTCDRPAHYRARVTCTGCGKGKEMRLCFRCTSIIRSGVTRGKRCRALVGLYDLQEVTA